MSFRKGFDTGYNLAVRHVIVRLEEAVADGFRASELSAELREFYKNELAQEGMTETLDAKTSG